jgi:hypothetical protein
MELAKDLGLFEWERKSSKNWGGALMRQKGRVVEWQANGEVIRKKITLHLVGSHRSFTLENA